jgi:hypothetical protein
LCLSDVTKEIGSESNINWDKFKTYQYFVMMCLHVRFKYLIKLTHKNHGYDIVPKIT